MTLNGKLAVITAAASGMGRAGCELFAAAGATVAAIDIDRARLQEVVEAVKAKGGKAVGIVADLSDPDACLSSIEDAAEALGGIDILWAHAGIPGLGGVEGLDLTQYSRVMDLNVRCSALAFGAALPHLRKRGGGSVVFTASIAGLIGSGGSPIYSAAKFAVVGLGKSLALRHAADHIRVNVVCPGLIDTPMAPFFFDANGDPERVASGHEKMIAGVPMARYGLPAEIAKAALFLASDDASFITGITLPVDGGFTAR